MVDSHDPLNEGKFPGNEAAFAELKEYVADGAVVAFTGAGVGVPVFPTWISLLGKMLSDAVSKGLLTNKVEIDDLKLLGTTDPLELASSLENVFPKEIFRARLSTVFENPEGRSSDCQTAIARLNLKGIVTLNYDNGHEVAYANEHHRQAVVGRSQNVSILTRWLQGTIFEQRDLPILHFHGDTTDPDQMIFTGDDYNHFYANPLSESLITQLWRANRLLVLGFGFSDPFLTRVAENTLRGLASDNRHFALIGRRQPKARAILLKLIR